VPAAYPFHLGTVLRASKARTQPAGFTMTMPRRGSGYAQALGTAPAVVWEVAFRFTRSEAVAFQLWFAVVLQRGVLDFTLPIRTEFGVQTHTCQFLPGTLMQAGEDGRTWSYRASILARAQLVPETAPDVSGLTTAWPEELPGILQASKRRSQAAPFSASDPGAGFAYFQATGADTPVLWDIELRFTQAQAALFQAWFVEVLDRGAKPFTMPVRTEFGLLDHELQFLPDGLLPASEDGETWGYRATVSARAQVIPQEFRDAAELIAGIPSWELWAEYLDPAINRELPEAA
jgi:hypothetical protein